MTKHYRLVLRRKWDSWILPLRYGVLLTFLRLNITKLKFWNIFSGLCIKFRKNGHILPTGQWYAPSAVHSVILCYTLLYSALLCFTLLYTALLCSTLLYTALLCSTLLYSALLCFTLFYSVLLYFTLLYSLIL